MSINLQLPTLKDMKPRITVIGVGGAGGNAINNMISSGLAGVEFIAANTDIQALLTSSAEQRIQLGTNLTEGQGAGTKPEIGEAAAEEALDEIRAQIAGSHMVFIACGMGGGTGTGAASVIARIAREEGILTVGIVSKPFQFEGSRRMRIAAAGIEEMRKYVDTMIVIPNQNLFRIANEKTTFAEAFILADQVLYSGIACIVDLIVKEGLINLDFADVRVIMSGMGSAMMGTGEGEGERRAIIAAEEAITNPLLDELTLNGARGLLISIVGGDDLTLYEVEEAASRVHQEVHPDANIIVGASYDDTLQGRVRVSIVASGMDRDDKQDRNAADHHTATPPPLPNTTPSAPEPQSPAQSAAQPRPIDPSASGNASLPAGSVVEVDKSTGRQAAGTGPAEAGTLLAALEPAMQAPQPQLQPHPKPQPVSALQPAPVTAEITNAPSRGSDAQAAQAFPAASKGASWQAPGNVLIEETAPQLARMTKSDVQPPAHTAAMPPGPTHPSAALPPMPGTHFAPAPPRNIGVGVRKMPTVEDFPVVGQRDYRVKSETATAPAVQTAPGPVNQPAKKMGFFERLTGRRNQAGDTGRAEPQQASYAHGYPQGATGQPRSKPKDPNHLTPNSTHSTAQDGDPVGNNPELPMFFGQKKR